MVEPPSVKCNTEVGHHQKLSHLTYCTGGLIAIQCGCINCSTTYKLLGSNKRSPTIMYPCCIYLVCGWTDICRWHALFCLIESLFLLASHDVWCPTPQTIHQCLLVKSHCWSLNQVISSVNGVFTSSLNNLQTIWTPPIPFFVLINTHSPYLWFANDWFQTFGGSPWSVDPARRLKRPDG